MNIFKRLAEKPWVNEPGAVVDMRGASYAASNQKVALVFLLAIIGVLFALFFAAYHMRLAPLEFGAGHSSDWVPIPEPPLLWFNTLVLGLASAAYEWARRTSNRGEVAAARLAFLAAGGATLAFLALQLVVWNQMIARGYYAHANPANSFFYLLTAVHGAHLLGGLIAWARAARRFADADHAPAQPGVPAMPGAPAVPGAPAMPRAPVQSEASVRLRRGIDLCALYWHFLLLVWLGMLALFVNT